MSRDTRAEPRYQTTTLREVIDEQGIRYIWVAEQLGWSKQRLNGVMAGTTTITHDQAKEVARILRVPFRLLFKLCNQSDSIQQSEDTAA